MFNFSVDEYFYLPEKVAKSIARRQIETSPYLLSDNELKIIQGTIDGILNSRENKKQSDSCFPCFLAVLLQRLFVDLLRR